jgi:Uma2 family endonuclease
MMVVEKVLESSGRRVVQEEPRPLLWTTEQFHQMGGSGAFEGLHVELIEGTILGMMTLGSHHVTAVTLVYEALREVFGKGYLVRSQAPLNIGRHTDPEPDVAVVRGNVRDYAKEHPSTALLIVEISDSTLRNDQTRKASLYARAGIEDYWIVNLNDNQLEVHRQPVPMSTQEFGYGYAEVRVFAATDAVAPLAAPHSTIAVADLLP